jgi:hypothetical protein
VDNIMTLDSTALAAVNATLAWGQAPVSALMSTNNTVGITVGGISEVMGPGLQVGPAEGMTTQAAAAWAQPLPGSKDILPLVPAEEVQVEPNALAAASSPENALGAVAEPSMSAPEPLAEPSDAGQENLTAQEDPEVAIEVQDPGNHIGISSESSDGALAEPGTTLQEAAKEVVLVQELDTQPLDGESMEATLEAVPEMRESPAAATAEEHARDERPARAADQEETVLA